MSHKFLCFQNWSSSVCGLALCWCKPWCHCTLSLLWARGCWVQSHLDTQGKTIKEFAVVQGTCLHVSNGKVVLKKCTWVFLSGADSDGRFECAQYLDFFMLTSVDEHLECIDFDRELWQQALPRLCIFFLETVLSLKYSQNVCWNNCLAKKLSWRLLIG